MLEFFVGKSNQRLERPLVTQPVFAAQFKDLGADIPLDQAENVGVGTALNLTQQTPLVGGQKLETGGLRQSVGQELLRKVERPPAHHVAVDVPADALGHLDAFGITLARFRLLRRLHVVLRPFQS